MEIIEFSSDNKEADIFREIADFLDKNKNKDFVILDISKHYEPETFTTYIVLYGY